jgi:choline monooxygenase
MKINPLLNDCQPIPLDDAVTLPAYLYHGEAALQLDQKAIFENSWQCVGHESQLKNPGDVLVTEVAGKPILVLRDHDGSLRSFYNVCKHRAGPLVVENGNVKILSCKYHGWSYQLNGQLRSAPEMSSTPNFDKCNIQLDAIHIDTWQGFILVNLSHSHPPVGEIFKGIHERITPIDLSTMQFHHCDEYLIRCNWKTYMDNYLEGYHLPHVHPGLNKLLDYKSYTTELFDWYSYQFSPLENAQSFYGTGSAHYFCVYPNLMLNILPGRCQLNRVLAIDHNHCKVIFDYYYADIESKATQQMIAEDLEFSDQVQDEDIAICEKVQKGLESGAYHQGRLCVKRENGVWHYQELLRKAYREYIHHS